MNTANRLFTRFDLEEMLQSKRNKVIQRITQENAEYILTVTEEDYVAHIVSEFHIEPIEIDRSGISLGEPFEKEISVQQGGEAFRKRRTFVTVNIPFTGDRELFFNRPSMYTGSPPTGEVTNEGELHLTIEAQEPRQVMKSNLESEIGDIEHYLASQRRQLNEWNTALPSLARTVFLGRKEKFGKDADVINSLGYPLRRRTGPGSTYVVPVRKKLLPKPSRASDAPGKNLAIATEVYEEILKALRNMGLVIERSPSVFEEMEEESLRMLFLVPLNGSFEGEATGETFNFEGKTDILLRKDGKNLFVAECKFWKGPSGFKDTVDQLLGYLTWRDSKTAILLFVRNTSMKTVLGQIPGLLRSHPSFQSEQSSQEEGEYRAKMKSARDASTLLDLSVLVFHVPSQPSS